MKTFLRSMLLAILAAAVSAPATAQELSPVGTWLSATGESSYEVTLCGDGTDLCAELIWLREDARTRNNAPYLNTYLVKEARKVSANRWKGKVHIYGQTLNGTITLSNADLIDLEGCLFIFCKAFKLNKVAD